MNSKNKINTKKNMDKLINSLGSLIASAGCRFILYQPEIPKKLVKNNKEKNWWGNHYEKYLITLATIVTLILFNSNCIEASYDRNGKRHSVIITQKSGSVVRYCAHTSNRKNENINTFYNYMVNNGITNFYVISFS